ncbi:hypothetical protein FK535_12995 [Mycolicibacterium sp. 018/SC-01/001]|uniref:hypothetical protein n=1 Tax=Mycolicibacterium sp. 018/SC-01/001 TaxID=2592069 RepID=UPI0011810E7B|nr:hypothetical protein [Mycolicibacterium sp. 018/SC-01/001]TRW82862.1 hypothetical protein FK535_12995 [Mycolicibacterium sp. 018/SC-01/001]
MTGPDDYTNTRPISVAELLAKNGTIGAPPVGGRRRRRRGNADAVTVAELTGEIPIVRPDEPAAEQAPEPEPTPEPEQVAGPETVDEVADDDELADAAEAAEVDDELVEVEESRDAEDTSEDTAEVTAGDIAENTSEDTAESQDIAEDTPEDTQRASRRSPFGRFGRKSAPAVDAELMSPDPVDTDVDTEVDEAGGTEVPEEPEDENEDVAAEIESPTDTDTEADSDTDTDTDTDEDELPSYLRSTQDPLFGGQTVADDVARRDTRLSTATDADADSDDADEDLDAPRTMSPLVHGLWVVGQSVVAVVFGAGLFVAFDQLWKWNNIVALVLSVLVILGLVVGVRVVRKTEDIGSTLIAVAVGALVTLGPLALLRSG